MQGERVALLMHLLNHSTKKVYHHHEPCHHRYHSWCQRPQNNTMAALPGTKFTRTQFTWTVHRSKWCVCSTATAGITHRISFFSFKNCTTKTIFVQFIIYASLTRLQIIYSCILVFYVESGLTNNFDRICICIHVKLLANHLLMFSQCYSYSLISAEIHC